MNALKLSGSPPLYLTCLVSLLVSGCNTLTYYRAPEGTASSRFTLVNPSFENVTIVHYANNSDCTGFEQVQSKPLPAGQELVVQLEAERDHSWGMTVFHSPDWQAIFGYIKTCVAYMTFPVEKGADYKATPTSDATGCSLRLEKLTSGSNQWEPVAVRKRALSTINGQICKPET